MPSPEGRRWWHSRILAILQSPTYRGRRVHHGQVLDEVAAAWPPLVDEATWWAVQRVLRDPARQAKRPERARHLLSHLARCAVCGGPLQVRAGNARQGQGRVYQCAERFCVAIGEATLDGYVERVLVRWLAGPARALLQPPADDAAAAAARTEVDRLRVELAELYRLVEAGEVGPAVAERAERGLRRRLDAAEVAAHAATVPPALAGVIGGAVGGAAAAAKARDRPAGGRGAGAAGWPRPPGRAGRAGRVAAVAGSGRRPRAGVKRALTPAGQGGGTMT